VLTRDEFFIVLSIVHNIGGYPFIKNGVESLGFSRSWGNDFFDYLLKMDKDDGKAQVKNLKIDKQNKDKIFKSFELFLKEIDEYESVSLTDHNKTEIQKLYEKIKEMYRD
jgi:hypothetical protein